LKVLAFLPPLAAAAADATQKELKAYSAILATFHADIRCNSERIESVQG